MAEKTAVQWCDSSVNGMMGCNGCELWLNGKGPCYAANITKQYAGQNGWPDAFDKPEIFPDRIRKACDWPDLTGKERPGKPWLNGLPRIIFLDDMGDTWTESLPVDWILPEFERMEQTPHQWLFLTKRPKRMKKAFEMYGHVPANFWLGTSVTSHKTIGRVSDLMEISGGRHWVSYEPAWQAVDFEDFFYMGLEWLVVGGESGRVAKPFSIDWADENINSGKRQDKAVFVKQIGGSPVIGDPDRMHQRIKISDLHGGNWDEWPRYIRVRQMPILAAVPVQNELALV